MWELKNWSYTIRVVHLTDEDVPFRGRGVLSLFLWQGGPRAPNAWPSHGDYPFSQRLLKGAAQRTGAKWEPRLAPFVLNLSPEWRCVVTLRLCVGFEALGAGGLFPLSLIGTTHLVNQDNFFHNFSYNQWTASMLRRLRCNALSGTYSQWFLDFCHIPVFPGSV